MHTLSRLVVSIALLWGWANVSAQGVFVGNQYDSLLFQQRVTSMDEFMNRFNGKESSSIDGVDTVERLKCLFRLCNRDVLEKNPDEWYSFLSDMAHDSVQLLYTNSNWTALASCIVDIDGEEDTITLVLKVEQVKRSIYKWVITQASGRVLSLSPNKKSASFIISPVDNELNFISLSDITAKNAQNILCYGSHDFQADETSVFFAFVANGYLKIKYVEDLVYQFDFPKYTFWVSYFNRETYNSGWLISDFFEHGEASQDNDSNSSFDND